MKWKIGLALAVVSLTVFALPECEGANGVRVATFNVHNYPKHDLQRTALPKAIGALDTPIIALQEVIDPAQLQADVRAQLGRDWNIVSATAGPSQRVAVLYDSSRAKLLTKREYTEPILHPSGRPALEVRMDVDGRVVRLMVVHLKAGGKFWSLRAAQWWSLLPFISDGMGADEDFSVVGDFNATGIVDRAVIFGMSLYTGGHWLTREMPCSHYWNRGYTCETTPLDHALTSNPGRARAEGACATVGCDASDQCPTWVHDVSDHCPVVIDF